MISTDWVAIKGWINLSLWGCGFVITASLFIDWCFDPTAVRFGAMLGAYTFTRLFWDAFKSAN